MWVGNVNSELVGERQLIQLFSRCGRVENVRILPKRYCAFINFESAESAAKAIQKLQVGWTYQLKVLLRLEKLEKNGEFKRDPILYSKRYPSATGKNTLNF